MGYLGPQKVQWHKDIVRIKSLGICRLQLILSIRRFIIEALRIQLASDSPPGPIRKGAKTLSQLFVSYATSRSYRAHPVSGKCTRSTMRRAVLLCLFCAIRLSSAFVGDTHIVQFPMHGQVDEDVERTI